MKSKINIASLFPLNGAGVPPTIQPEHDDDYPAFLEGIKTTFNNVVGTKPSLFTTATSDLFDVFLDNLPYEYRQHHTCRTCRKFFDTYAGLVYVEDDGRTYSVMLDEANVPAFYRTAVYEMRRIVEKAPITGVFVTEERVWGTPTTQDHKNFFHTWTHASVTPPKEYIHVARTQSAHQVSAEKLQDYQTMERALQEFSIPILQQAVTLLDTDALYRSEKVLGVAKWLLGVKNLVSSEITAKRKANRLWVAVAKAPAGFTHPRSSMIGTLLEDLIAGMDYDQVSKRFAAKMAPTAYMRPTAAPSAGNIAQADKLFNKLEAEGSLRRRYARFDEVKLKWAPTSQKKAGASSSTVFGHLTPRAHAAKHSYAPPQVMTWDKFIKKILPTAAGIKMVMNQTRMPFIALVTAVDPMSPPVIQWDFDDERNPVSWYVYSTGNYPADFNLSAGTYADVTGITDQPSSWGRGVSNQGESVILILKDCRDTTGHASSCLFPEIMKSEYHGVRKTLEAYNRSSKMEEAHNASACGVRISAKQASDVVLQVTDFDGSVVLYKIDRWD